MTDTLQQGISKMRLRAVSAPLALAVVLAVGVGATQSAQAQAFTVLYSFEGGTDGENSNTALIRDAAGNLFGTTEDGGGNGCYAGYGCGAVFEVDAADTETVLYRFTGGADGGTPGAGLIQDTEENLYGTAEIGGAFGYGVVFKLDTTGTETVLYNFTGGDDGGNPRSALISDTNGNFYGTTSVGGTYGYGTVFELSPSGNSWTETVLYSFNPNNGKDGYYPGDLVFDHKGNLYGTTSGGGIAAVGTVFSLTRRHGVWTERLLYSFTGGDNGWVPTRSVVFDNKGRLYGTTESGGADNAGVVFRLTPSKKGAWTISVLYYFTGNNDGGYPYAPVTLNKAGDLYGTTFSGGYYQAGTVFELRPVKGSKWKEVVVYNFTGGSDGGNPEAAVIFDQAGAVYGTASDGANEGCLRNNGCGTVWKLTP